MITSYKSSCPHFAQRSTKALKLIISQCDFAVNFVVEIVELLARKTEADATNDNSRCSSAGKSLNGELPSPP